MKPSVLVACALLLAACTSPEPPTAQGSPEEPPPLTVEARGIPLLDGADSAPRFLIDAAERSANVIVNAYAAADRVHDPQTRVAPSGLRIHLCPLESETAPVVLDDRCRRDIGNGVREPVSSGAFRGLAVVAAGVTGHVLADVIVQYAEGSRTLTVRFPFLRGPVGGTDCADNGCNPFIEMKPTHNGRMNASARWSGPNAALVLLQGNIVGRSQTATGIPYREAAVDRGTSPLAIQATMSTPGEYALALRHERLQAGELPLEDVRIEARWP